jgi:hypothetical protein
MLSSEEKELFQPTVKARAWGNSIPQHLSFLAWYLEHHPEILETLFCLCDQHQRRKPGAGMSVQDAFAVARWNSSIGANDDVFSINRNLISCYTRLYLRERPQAQGLIEKRNSFLDSLSTDEQKFLDDALEQGRKRLDERNP